MPFVSNIIVQKEINLSSIEVYSSYAVGNILVDLGHTQGADENDTCYVIDRAVRYPEGTPSEWKDLLKNGFAKMMETALFSTTRYDGLTLCAVSDMASEKHLRFLAIFKDFNRVAYLDARIGLVGIPDTARHSCHLISSV